MPRFRCLRGFWNFPVDVDSVATAQIIFRCGECCACTGHCLGVGKGETQIPLGDLSSALRELSNTAPTRVPIWLRLKSTAPGGGRNRNLSGLVQQYYEDIVSARNNGHSFYAIAEVFCEHGIEISRSSLQVNYRKIGNERGINNV